MAGQVCVIVNPAAGRGRAARRLEELRRLSSNLEVKQTTAPGQGEELAYEAAQAGFSVVAAAGGDGTVHEVANGVLRAGRPEVVFHVLPVGSANDYAYTLDKTGPPEVRRVDVGVARGPNGRQRYFVNGMGLGFNGAVTREARRIRWLRGVPLYGLALLRALRKHYACPELTLTFDDQKRVLPTLALTVALGRREGSFLLTPEADLSDGLFDWLHAGALRRWELATYLPAMVSGNVPKDDPKVTSGRCRRAQVQSETPLCVHLDGEFFCLPEEGVTSMEVELLPQALRVRSGPVEALVAPDSA